MIINSYWYRRSQSKVAISAIVAEAMTYTDETPTLEVRRNRVREREREKELEREREVES